MTTQAMMSHMCQSARDVFKAAGIDSSRIVQTEGDAPASAGTHGPDGTEHGISYSCAIDLSVKHPTRLTVTEIDTVLTTMATHGFVGWYRNTGHDGWPASDGEHMHFVFVDPPTPMKIALQEQVHDWCHNPIRTGLVGHTDYQFWQPSPALVQSIRTLFLAHNPATP